MYAFQKALIIALLMTPAWSFAEDEAPAVNEDVIYVELTPPFVTNYMSNKVGYIKADVTLKVKGGPTAEAINRHEPFIRHNLVMLFSRQASESINSMEGKQHLKEEALNEVISVLESEGEATNVEDILFTSFIVD